MIFNSIRSRLTAWYVGLLAVILILFSVLLYIFLSKRLYESVDNSLHISANMARKTAQVKYPRRALPGMEVFFDQFLGGGNRKKSYRFYDRSGKVGPQFKGLYDSKFPLSQTAYMRALEGKKTYENFPLKDEYPHRVLTIPVMRNNTLANLIQVGTSLEGVEETLKNLRLFLFTAVPAVLILATLVGRFFAGQALSPVSRITKTASDIAHGADLNKRIEDPKVQDEIGVMVITFNQMMDRLSKSFSQMRQFSSDASHELRTPLTVLKGQSELLLNKTRTPEEYQEVLSSNLEEINYMSRILDDLFVLSKADESKLPWKIEDVDLAQIIEEVCRHGEILADEKNIKIIVAYFEPVHVKGDAHRLRQLTWNLIHNAIKYTPEGGEIKVTLQELPDYGYLTIQDSGMGIPEEDLPLIFNRFYRVDKARARVEGGSGLGLSICKSIVDWHKGEIDLESEVGVGTKFKIKIPKIKSLKPEKV
ncbi:MAG: sensor histidine kinase [Nitrospinales bacterium]